MPSDNGGSSVQQDWGRRLLIVVCLLVAGRASFADDEVNLLRLPQAAIDWTTQASRDLSSLQPLTDGDAQTVAIIPATEGTQVDIIYSFGGEAVAPSGVRIKLADKAAPARIEVLASTVSARTGFHSLRSDPIDPARKVQTFTFPASAARWVMLRLTPAPGASSIATAEVELLGRPGMPQSNYVFAESPARAIDILARLSQTAAVIPALTDEENAIFLRARNASPDPAAFAEISLLASGVTDPARRKTYVRRIDDLERAARVAVAGARTPSDKGRLLLDWLHKGAMKKGYEDHQTDLSVLLDTGKFNCVSSATMYNILALRLGLDMRAIEVPDHAFSIFYDGTSHMDVETTNASGFNPTRDREAVARFEKLTGFHYIPESHRDQRREINEAGLAALIYYNHGVMLGEQKRYHEALLAYFRAMSLDPEFASAAKNALAVLANWGVMLSRDGNWQAAIDVVATGLALAPKDAALTNNYTAIWGEWGVAMIDAGKPDEAVRVLKRAAVAVPTGGFTAMQAAVYIQPGERLVNAGKWNEAFALGQAGAALLDPEPQREFERWRDELYLRYFNAEYEAHRLDVAADVLVRGIAQLPADSRLKANAGFLAQEWARQAAADHQFAAGIQVLEALRQRFPGIVPVADASRNFVRRNVIAAVEAGHNDEAFTLLSQGQEFLRDDDAKQLGVMAFDTQAKAHMKAGAWQQAADTYAAGLERYPGADLLVNNVGWMAQEWQRAAYATGGSPGLGQAAQLLAIKFPAIPAIREEAANQVHRIVKTEIDAGRFAEAEALLAANKSILSATDAQSLGDLIYDTWAKRRIAAHEWSGAADVYAEALTQVGPTPLLNNNIGFLTQEWARSAYASSGTAPAFAVLQEMKSRFSTVSNVSTVGANVVNFMVKDIVHAGRFADVAPALDQAAIFISRSDLNNITELAFDKWARTFIDRKDWMGAIRVYEDGLLRLPEDALLTQNKAYCAQFLK